MPKLVRSYPLTRREPVIQSPCDRAFDVAEKSYQTALARMREAAATCIYTTGRSLLSACRHFDQSDPDLAKFMTKLQNGLAARDFSSLMHASREFMNTVDRSKITWSDESSAEAALVAAIMSYDDALEQWSDDKHSEAHANTVRCRSSLTKIED